MNKKEKIKQIYENFSAEYYSDKFDNLREALNVISKREEKKFPHPLGKFVIFYSIPTTSPQLVIVGNNPSWFHKSKTAIDKEGLNKAEKNLRDVAEKIPTVNSYKEHDHKFGNQIIDVFNYCGKSDWVDTLVGLNRFFIQTGGGGTAELKKECKKLDGEDENTYSNIEDLCNDFTRELVDILNPKLVILIGDDAKKSTFPSVEEYPRSYDENRITFLEAIHPSNRNGGWIKTAKDIRNFMEDNSLL
tara:strand:- start:1029 stop:1766 length:738 start_codon:yes stop_codon:yes gene_type:complete